MFHHFGVIFAAILTWASAASATEEWFLLSREDGCVGLDLLARGERLARVPRDPEDFAAMMRERGHRASAGLPDGFPIDLAGRAVMVRYAENRAPVFMREDLCRGGGKR
ncbi:MAG: hypothetical protein IT564_04415 [Rhodospirillales bacterium]|nr:hypothetical protein [Rhodospirillales bacterium]